MSYFTVLVVGDNIEGQLQPYHEYECTGTLDQYVQFVDYTEEVKKAYEEGSDERIRLPNGELIHTYDNQLYRPATEEELEKIGSPIGSGVSNGIIYRTERRGHNLRDVDVFVHDTTGMEQITVPYTQLYADYKEYAEEVEGYIVHEDGERVGRMTNPNAKWDWWVVGGRWTGFFKVKSGATGARLGEPGTMTDAAPNGYADSLLIRDIDFEGMREEARLKAEEEYDAFQRATEGVEPPTETWEELLARHGDKNIDAAQEEWHRHPWICALRDADIHVFMQSPLDYFCVRTGGREKFVKNAVNRAVATFAVVKDGQWYERGSMGWWGIVTDEEDQDTWLQKMNELLDGLSEDTRVTVVDCHI